MGNATVTEIRDTLKGDANLDGTVNDADLLVLLQNYGSSTTLWTNGNFEATAATGTGASPANDADLLDLLQNYGATAAAPLQSAGTLVQSPAPAPPPLPR